MVLIQWLASDDTLLFTSITLILLVFLLIYRFGLLVILPLGLPLSSISNIN